MYSEWTQSVDEVANANLEKPLLVRNTDTQLVSVNFDPKVHRLFFVFCSPKLTLFNPNCQHFLACMTTPPFVPCSAGGSAA